VPVPVPETVAARAPGAGDMFLSVTGAKAGAIAGEAQDSAHKNEIEVLGWSWGMQGRRDLVSGHATGKATIRELRVIKRVDKASTALMNALRTNEEVKAKLTLRKTGKSPLEYLKISIENGFVSSIEIEGGDVSGGSALVERISFTFNKISVEYTPQGPDGRALGGTTFEDQWTPSS
jgi:type VI secretion system secreted protein Hcp